MSFDNWVFLIQGRYFVYHEGSFYEIKECTSSAPNKWYNNKDKRFYQAIKRIEALMNTPISKILNMFN